MHLINEEQFNEMGADLAELIGLIQQAQNNFNPQELKKEIALEIKETLRKNSPFKRLESEVLSIEDSLMELKKIKRVYQECKNQSDIKLLIASIVSMFFGGLLTVVIFKVLGV